VIHSIVHLWLKRRERANKNSEKQKKNPKRKENNNNKQIKKLRNKEL
jgi:hypothetical protein